MEAATETTWRAGASAAALVPRRTLSDKRLAVMAAGDDRAAFAELYRRYHQPLYRYCRSLLGNEEEARDAVQMTFLSALRSLPGETRKIELKAWLYRVAHNESISILRSRRPVEGMDAIEELPQEDTATAAARRAELRMLVTDMGELSERQRGALVMRELSGLSYAEIAAALDISVGAAKQSVFKARTGLQELAEGREMVCSAVRETISEADGRLLVARRIRGHLRGCAACRDFRSAIEARGVQLQMLAPPLAAVPAAQLLSGLLGGAEAAAGGAGTATTAATASAAAGKIAGLSGASVAVKAMAIGAATVAVSAGAVGLNGGLPGGAESSSSSSPANGERVVPHDPGLRNGSGGAGKSEKRSGAGRRSGDGAKSGRKVSGSKRRQGSGPAAGAGARSGAAARPQGPAAAPVSPPAGRPSATPAPAAGSGAGAGGGSAAATSPADAGTPEGSAPAPASPTSPSEASSSTPSSPVELPDDAPLPRLP